MVYCIFSKCMNDTVTSADLIGDGMIQISRWCSGERPIYNNLSNTYLYLKKMKEAAEALKKAFEIRKKYEHLGLMESHDTLQQMANLANMLIIGNELAQARELLNLYESLILEYENNEWLCCGCLRGSQPPEEFMRELLFSLQKRLQTHVAITKMHHPLDDALLYINFN